MGSLRDMPRERSKPPRCLGDVDSFRDTTRCGTCDYYDPCRIEFWKWIYSSPKKNMLVWKDVEEGEIPF
jgi:hypothetical protein